MKVQKYDLIIIGGGQAGLAAAYHARQKNLNYLVLEASEAIGQSWRDRYDSLTLFTPRKYSSLPGMTLEGDQSDYPSKDEISSYLHKYTTQFALSVRLGENVTSVTKEDNIFYTATHKGTYESAAVIIATGPFQIPRTPEWNKKLTIPQIHSVDYRNPRQVQGSKVLVVGGGNSGAQIAEELAKDNKVTMAVMGSIRFMPARILGKSLFWWLNITSLLNAPTNSFGAKLLRKRGDPIIGTNLKGLIQNNKVTIKPVASNGSENTIVFADDTNDTFDSIVWCTGFTLDYPWLQITGTLDDKGLPIQKNGKSEVAGLYFLGLGWMRSRNSALLGGVGRDAGYLIDTVDNLR